MKKISDLTDNFGRWEFFVSGRFPDLARKAMYMRDINLVDDRLYLLCKIILQPVRNFIGEPMTLNSGFRDRGLNSAIGGEENSLHLRAKAADFTIKDKSKLLSCYEYIKDEFGDKISELFLYRDSDDVPVFIHVALADIFKKEKKIGFLEVK
jgi:hypothetical protein